MVHQSLPSTSCSLACSYQIKYKSHHLLSCHLKSILIQGTIVASKEDSSVVA